MKRLTGFGKVVAIAVLAAVAWFGWGLVGTTVKAWWGSSGSTMTRPPDGYDKPTSPPAGDTFPDRPGADSWPSWEEAEGTARVWWDMVWNAIGRKSS